MRSIPAALTWELLRRGWWQLPMGILAANALPAFMLMGMRRVIESVPHDSSILIMHIVLLQVSMLVLGATVFTIQGNPARLYTLPVRNSTIVAWHLLPLMVIMFLESVASTAALNAAFGIDWPLWGPAIFLAVTLAAMNAVQWLLEKSAWLVVGIGILLAGLGLWFKMRYGNLTGQPDRLWTHVTWPEALTMLSVAAMAFAVGIYAVGRNRRGEPPVSVGIVSWFEKLLDGSAAPSASFQTPQQAQFWAEWRQKGWVMPGAAIFGVLFGLLIWLLASRHANDLLEGVAAGGMMLPAVGIIAGLLIGNVGHNDSSFEMAQFRATRPLTSTEMAWSLLKVSAKSVLAGWIVWVATLVVTVVALYLIGANVNPFNPAAALIFVPAALVGGWIFVTTVASAALTGRGKQFTIAMCVLMVISVSLSFYTTQYLPYRARLLVVDATSACLGVGMLLYALGTFIVARRRGIVSSSTAYAALCAFGVLCGWVGVFLAYWHPRVSVPVVLLLVGLAALAVAPLAAAPLAIAWNRTR